MKKILVAIDGSPRQQGVMDAAVGIANMTGAKLVLFRAVGVTQDIPDPALTMTPDEVVTFLEEHARKDLLEQQSCLDPSLRGGVRVTVGLTWPSIERAAEDEGVDLIMVGSHGYGGIDRVLGTVAAKVVNHADRSVLVVRAPERLAA